MRVAPHRKDSVPLEETATTPNIQRYFFSGKTSTPLMIRAWIGRRNFGFTCVSP
jgi:hypothetical protein